VKNNDGELGSRDFNLTLTIGRREEEKKAQQEKE